MEPDLWTNSVPNRWLPLTIVTTVFLPITAGCFVTRSVWRWHRQEQGWDDLMAVCAYIIFIFQSAFVYKAALNGFGKHRTDVSTLSETVFWLWLCQIFYKLLGGFTKLTFCLLYLRIFEISKILRPVYAIGAVIAFGSLAFTFTTIFQCTPVRRSWDHGMQGECVEFAAFWFAYAVFNTSMDLVIFILPIPLIHTLPVANKTKAGLISIFSLGAFTIAASVIRAVTVQAAAGSDMDQTWDASLALLWTQIEANTAMICCCLPALRQAAVALWRRIRKGIKPTAKATKTVASHERPGVLRRRSQSGGYFGNWAEAHHSPARSSDHQAHCQEGTEDSESIRDILARLEEGNTPPPQIEMDSLDFSKGQENDALPAPAAMDVLGDSQEARRGSDPSTASGSDDRYAYVGADVEG